MANDATWSARGAADICAGGNTPARATACYDALIQKKWDPRGAAIACSRAAAGR